MLNLKYIDAKLIIETKRYKSSMTVDENIHYIVIDGEKIYVHFYYHFILNINKITCIKTFDNTYYFKNCKLHSLYDCSIEVMIGFEFIYFIEGIGYTHKDWLIKCKIIKRNQKLKDILC